MAEEKTEEKERGEIKGEKMPPALSFPDNIFLITTRLAADEVRQLEAQIGTLTRDASQATIFVGKVSRKERAQFELRRLGVYTEVKEETPLRPVKRRKTGSEGSAPMPISISDSETEAEDGDGEEAMEAVPPPLPPGTLWVVKLAWLTDSLARDEVMPLSHYVVYLGRRVPGPPKQEQEPHSQMLCRGGVEAQKAPPPLKRKTTAEHDAELLEQRAAKGLSAAANDGTASGLPPIPAYLHTAYSCQRPTPLHPANEAFVEVLKQIRVTRQLMGDRIGVRAYSTAIATLSAYPNSVSAPAEVSRLPGCGPKIAELFREFSARGGHVREAEDAANDRQLQVLHLFFGIWGVAEATARAFYQRGWRDLDDVVEFGWAELSRVQQIGVKYYEELQVPMARAEVEQIAATVLAHANKLGGSSGGDAFQMLIAGGYRRGKELSGDVDVILSHRDETATHLLIQRLVRSLEQAGLITHTLILSTANSMRGQEAVSWKGSMPRASASNGGGGGGGNGFDTLDKALVVWQNRDGGGGGGGGGKHRRVDIIVSPWKTVGCAVLGWSGGTTFQRDLRRYCKYERGLRFDSSGARRRTDGTWVDLENFCSDPAPDMLTAERRVFAALGLDWRPPEERCTG